MAGTGIRPKRARAQVPTDWLASAVALLQLAHPSIRVQRQTVARLLEFLTWQWRLGHTPRQAVAMICASGGVLRPSAGAYVDSRPARPPKGATAGQAFGADELRQAPKLERLSDKLRKLEEKRDELTTKAEVAEVRAEHSQRPAKRAELRDKASEARRKAAGLAAQMAELQATLTTEQRRSVKAGEWSQVRSERVTKRAQGRRAGGAAVCPPDQSACALGLQGAICGLPATLVLASARGAPLPQTARYCLTSADRLIPSHDARRGFVKRDDYPTDVQEREYHRDRGEQIKVLSTAQNLIPALIFNGAPGAIDGLPVVTPQGVVLGGNGRTQALQLHYHQGGRAARDFLLDHAGQFGFSRQQVEAIADPVVVRVVSMHPPDSVQYKRAAQELVRLLNVPLTQSLGVRAESVAESRRLSDEVLEILSVALGDGQTSLADYLSSRQSRPLMDALRRSSILSDRNVARYILPDGGAFSEDGKRFVERLLTAAIVPSAELLEQLGPGTVGMLARGAPWILSAAAAGEAWDLRPGLYAAAKDLADLRGRSIESVPEYLRQGSMFGKPASLGNPTAEKLLVLLFDAQRKPTLFYAFAKAYAGFAARNPINQVGLFPSEQVSPQDGLDRALQGIH